MRDILLASVLASTAASTLACSSADSVAPKLGALDYTHVTGTLAFRSNDRVDDAYVITILHGEARTSSSFLALPSTVLSGSIALSPDGTRVAYAAMGPGPYQIVVQRSDGSGAKRLTSAGTHQLAPAWSADGTSIFYLSSTDGGPVVRRMKDDGTGVVTVSALPALAPIGVSPKGDALALAVYAGKGSDAAPGLYRLGADGASPLRLRDRASGRQESAPTFSPDGQRIAFVSVHGLNEGPAPHFADLMTMASDGTDVQVVVRFALDGAGDPPTSLAWSPDGARIAVDAPVGGTTKICIVDLASKTWTTVNSSGWALGPSWVR